MGESTTILQSIFYSGFLAYSVSSLPIVIPEISSELKTAEIPINSATLFAVLTKFTFAILGCTLIMSSSTGQLQYYSLIGAGVYALFLLLPSIIQVQAKVQLTLFYRG